MADKTPGFRRPPISELVCGIAFNRLSAFGAPYVGLLWKECFRDFPNPESAPPLLTGATESLSLEELQFPRIWFVAADERTLIQVQNDRLLFNWRKRADDDEYPRFDTVFSEFKKHFANFSAFVAANRLGIIEAKRFELTYVNHILVGDGWETFADIGTLFPDLSWRNLKGRFLPTPELMAWRATFSLPDKMGTLNVSISPGKRTRDKRDILQMELTAIGHIGGDADSMSRWFSVAHDWIVFGFADLTSEKVQAELWQRTA